MKNKETEFNIWCNLCSKIWVIAQPLMAHSQKENIRKRKVFGHLKKIEWSVLIVHVMQYAVQVQFPFRW